MYNPKYLLTCCVLRSNLHQLSGIGSALVKSRQASGASEHRLSGGLGSSVKHSACHERRPIGTALAMPNHACTLCVLVARVVRIERGTELRVSRESAGPAMPRDTRQATRCFALLHRKVHRLLRAAVEATTRMSVAAIACGSRCCSVLQECAINWGQRPRRRPCCGPHTMHDGRHKPICRASAQSTKWKEAEQGDQVDAVWRALHAARLTAPLATRQLSGHQSSRTMQAPWSGSPPRARAKPRRERPRAGSRRRRRRRRRPSRRRCRRTRCAPTRR